MAAQPHVIAIDPGLTVGVARGRPGEIPRLYSRMFGRDDGDADEFFARVMSWIATELRNEPANVLAIEPPIPTFKVLGSSAYLPASQTDGCFAICVGAAKCKGLEVRRAKPGTWRKAFLGRGDYAREIAKSEARRVCDDLGWKPDSVHSAEAGGIWYWYCHEVASAVTPDASLFWRKAVVL